ncbi:MAG: hypothetical protein LKG11_00310 [Bacilli bacterium]|jgi:hypothetical protein|nr:hypothetical protein [Bacilli bacterium]
MAYQYFNAHPKGLNVKDCVVRAVSIAFERDYSETRLELNRSKRDLGYPSYKETKFIYDYLDKYERLKFKSEVGKPRVKVDDFCVLFPLGTYILKISHHLTVVKDGVNFDTWDCGYRSVYTAWRIK